MQLSNKPLPEALPVSTLQTAEQVKYAVDLIMCIDGTASMKPVIEDVKSTAATFYPRVLERMQSKSKHVDQFRIKVIVYRDYWADAANMAMQISPFFDMGAQGSDYENFVREIKADGGGDIPENALEAIALALQSDWEKGSTFSKRRQVIIVFTDADAHDLEKPGKPDHYPTGIPSSFDELTDLWEQTSSSPKRLVMFAPDATPWSIISSAWAHTAHYPSKAGQGMDEIDFDSIIEVIAASI